MTLFPWFTLKRTAVPGTPLWAAAALLLCWAPVEAAAQAAAADLHRLTTAQLYEVTNIWPVHLQFTPEAWEAMEPKGNPGGFFGRPPEGPGGRGGPPAMGPGMILAPAFLKEGDQDHDERLTQTEFHDLAVKWFAAWDKHHTGKLDLDDLRSGLNSTVSAGGFGPRGGPPGGRGFGMNLQGAEGKRNGLASASGLEFQYVRADLDFAGVSLKNVAVRYKGNGTFMQSRDSLKRSLKVDLAKFAKGRTLAGVSKLNLHNNVTDASWMNEVMSHRLFRDAGVPAPRTAYARLYVTVPGRFDHQYFGLYSLVEDVDQNFAEEHYGTKQGAILKPVTPSLFAYLGEDWKAYNQTYDPKTKLTPQQQKRIIEFCKLVSQAGDREFADRLGDYVDLDEFARFLSVEVWLSTLDSILTIGQNYYVYLNPGKSQFQFLPWDLDHSFGQFFMMGGQEEREQLSILHPWRGENRFLERVFQAPAFKNLYLAKLNELNRTLFQPERFFHQVDEIAAAIRPAVQEESPEKLARFDHVVAGEAVGPAAFGNGPRFGGPGGFFPTVKPIKGFVKARAASVTDQLSGRSQGEPLPEFGFGPPGGRGGRGGPPPGGFGPGMFLGPAFLEGLDANQDGSVSRDEFMSGFAKWFQSWDAEHKGSLNSEELQAGVNRELSSFHGGPPPN